MHCAYYKTIFFSLIYYLYRLPTGTFSATEPEYIVTINFSSDMRFLEREISEMRPLCRRRRRTEYYDIIILSCTYHVYASHVVSGRIFFTPSPGRLRGRGAPRDCGDLHEKVSRIARAGGAVRYVIPSCAAHPPGGRRCVGCHVRVVAAAAAAAVAAVRGVSRSSERPGTRWTGT